MKAVRREAGGGRRGEKALLDFFERLAPEQQDRLIALAELLVEQAPGAAQPVAIPRAPGETVVMAIRRLSRTYRMLDRRKLMVDASRLMAQHALEGRPAQEVIGELEQVFERHYRRMKAEG